MYLHKHSENKKTLFWQKEERGEERGGKEGKKEAIKIQ